MTGSAPCRGERWTAGGRADTCQHDDRNRQSASQASRHGHHSLDLGGAQRPLTGFQWRQSLNNPALSPRAQALQKRLWEEIFDSLEVGRNARGDYVGTLNRPETLNPILDQILGRLDKP